MDEVQKLRDRVGLPALKDTQGIKAVKRWLHLDADTLPEGDREALHAVLHSSKVLETVYSMRQELGSLWNRSNATREQLLKQLEDWCRRAEASEIAALQKFSRRLRCYA